MQAQFTIHCIFIQNIRENAGLPFSLIDPYFPPSTPYSSTFLDLDSLLRSAGLQILTHYTIATVADSVVGGPDSSFTLLRSMLGKPFARYGVHVNGFYLLKYWLTTYLRTYFTWGRCSISPRLPRSIRTPHVSARGTSSHCGGTVVRTKTLSRIYPSRFTILLVISCTSSVLHILLEVTVDREHNSRRGV